MLDELPIIIPAEVDQNQAFLSLIGDRDYDRVQDMQFVILFYKRGFILLKYSHSIEPTHALDWIIKGSVPTRRLEVIESNMSHAVNIVGWVVISRNWISERIREILNQKYIIDCVLIFILHIGFLDLREYKQLFFKFIWKLSQRGVHPSLRDEIHGSDRSSNHDHYSHNDGERDAEQEFRLDWFTSHI